MARGTHNRCFLVLAAVLAASPNGASLAQTGFYMKIAFAGYNPPAGGETLTNFPALVVLGEHLPSFYYSQFVSPADGGDLRFLNSNRTAQLNYEIEEWNTAGKSYAWVQAPALEGTNTYIWAHWGNGSNSVPPACTTNGATWSEGYRGVWHFGLTNGVIDIKDSTANRHNGTNIGVIAGASAMIGYGLDFEKDDSSYIKTARSIYFLPASNAPITVSYWMKPESVAPGDNATNRVITIHDGGPSTGLGLGCGSSDRMQSYFDTGLGATNWNAQTTVDAGKWYHVALAYDGATYRLYANGGYDSSKTAGLADGSTYGMLFGTYSGSTAFFDGIVDEMRISDRARSSNWVWACYANQSLNDSFNAYTPETGIRNNPASAVSATSAVLNATLYATGQVVGVSVHWGATDGGTNLSDWSYSSDLGSFTTNGPASLSYTATGLVSDTGYCFRFRATNTVAAGWAPDSKSFKTLFQPSSAYNRMKVTFSGYDRSETLTNFPALVVFGSNLTNFAYGEFAPGGADLHFLDETQSQELNYEIEEWNTGGDSFVWVQVPELTNNCFVWAYWGKLSVTSPPVCATNGAVWSGEHVLVCHLNASELDSTTNRHDGANAGSTNATGMIANGQGFDGTGNYVSFGDINAVDGAAQLTVSMWVKSADTNDGDLMTKGWHTVGVPLLFWRDDVTDSGTIDTYAALAGSKRVDGANNACNDQWQHVAFTFIENNSAGLRLYIDGREDPYESPNASSNMPSNASSIRIGAASSGSKDYLGLLDEVRIENVSRSSNWIWACWMSQASNRWFNTYGRVKDRARGSVLTIR